MIQRRLRDLYRAITGRHGFSGDVWGNLLRENSEIWSKSVAASRSGPRVLMGTSLGGYDHGTMLESALAVALTLRGAKVDILLCDGFLPACQLSKIGKIHPESFAKKGPEDICGSCIRTGNAIFSPLGLTIHNYGNLVTPDQASQAREQAASVPFPEIGDYRFDGLAVGEHALAGALRYFGRGELAAEPLGDAVARRYLEAALLSVFAVRNLTSRESYDVACFHHGIYVPQGLIGEVCRKRGIRVVNSNPSYRKQTFIFSHGDSYHHTMISEPTSQWEEMEWTPATEKVILDYLKSRWQGTQDWIWFHEKPQEDAADIARAIGVDFSRPTIGMLTNVMWDAQLHYKSNAFPSMLSWVLQSIEYFANRPDLQLVIRVHPAEVRGMIPSRQPIVPEIRKAFPRLPANVFIVAPESPISTYAAMENCDAVIIYNTKTGIELSSMGIPVIVAGEAWIRNKGFSLDASSPQEYIRILDGLPLGKRLRPEQLSKARKYAYHFFFRRMIELPFLVSPEKFRFAIRISSLDDLLPGRTPGLDVVCDGILKGAPFVFPHEKCSASQ